MTPAAGEIWLADRGGERPHRVFIVSDARFHRLADRAVVAPLLDEVPGAPRPWHIRHGDGAVAVNQLGTTPVDRLLERIDQATFETVRRVRHAVGEITS